MRALRLTWTRLSAAAESRDPACDAACPTAVLLVVDSDADRVEDQNSINLLALDICEDCKPAQMMVSNLSIEESSSVTDVCNTLRMAEESARHYHGVSFRKI